MKYVKMKYIKNKIYKIETLNFIFYILILMRYLTKSKKRKRTSIVKKSINKMSINKRSINKMSRSKKIRGGGYKETNWLKLANIQYDSLKEVRKNYQSWIKSDKELVDIEQKWVDKNLEVIIDFMGDIDVWNFVIQGVVVYGFDGSKASTRNKPVVNYPIAVFTGSHWNSRKANESDWFEPYDDYQIFGTNQFCQTFAMMYLADRLPLINYDTTDFTKYYTYTIEALNFIEEVINAYPSSTLNDKKAIRECLKYPNICLNSIEFP